MLNWRTPYEHCRGDTLDISPFYQFFFYDKVRFISGVSPQFPLTKEVPGRYLGTAWNTGDILTYKIENDSSDVNTHTVLHRSSVILDDCSNKIVNQNRKQDPEEGKPWEYVFFESDPKLEISEEDLDSSLEEESEYNNINGENLGDDDNLIPVDPHDDITLDKKSL